MKIIDYCRKGNVVRFYLGEKTSEWGWTNPNYKFYDGTTPDWLAPSDRYYGDDWNDRPYEHNAGPVYDEFIKGYKDVAFPFDDLVIEPSDDWKWEGNSPYSKDDMVARKIPCLIVVPAELKEKEDGYLPDNFTYWIGNASTQKIYFGDDMEPDVTITFLSDDSSTRSQV